MSNLFPALGPRRASAFQAMGRTSINNTRMVGQTARGNLPSTYDAKRPRLDQGFAGIGMPDISRNRQANAITNGLFSPTGRPQFDPDSTSSVQELNIKLLISPRTTSGTVSFEPHEFICLERRDHDLRDSPATTVDRAVGFMAMNAQWRASFDACQKLIRNGLHGVVPRKVNTGHAASSVEFVEHRFDSTSQPANPSYVTKVSDFTEKYNRIGPFVSVDAQSKEASNGGFRADPGSSNITISAKLSGTQVNMPNVFGQTTAFAHVGYCVGARQHLDPRRHPEDQTQRPIQWTPWSSAQYKRPFLESNPADLIKATAKPGQRQRMLNVMCLGVVIKGIQKGPISFMSDLSRSQDVEELHMRGTEVMNSDLAYLALDVMRNPTSGLPEYYWRYESAFFVNLGASKLVTGDGVASVDALIGMMDDPSSYRERSHQSLVSVRMVR